MGFLDKVKGTARQAVRPGEQAATRDRVVRINQCGVVTTATIVALTEVGEAFGGRELEFSLAVDPPDGGPSYPVTTRQSMVDGQTSGWGPGTRLSVKVDPEDRESLLVWGGA